MIGADNLEKIMARYSWFGFFFDLADRDPVKMEQVVKLPMMTLITCKNYQRDFNYVMGEAAKRQ